ncbi:MAG: hypothetical protein ACK47B_01075 [Armatimonadota bacterium]
MSIEASGTAYAAGRIQELERENRALQEQLRRLATQQTALRGAMQEVEHEREATTRIAQQVRVEEQATRAAVEVQNSSLNLSVVLQVLNFFMLIVLVCGLFFWLPKAVAASAAAARPSVTTSGGTALVR